MGTPPHVEPAEEYAPLTTYQDQPATLDGFRRFLEGGALIDIAAGAFLALQTLKAIEQSTDAIRHQTKTYRDAALLDQRPWLKLKPANIVSASNKEELSSGTDFRFTFNVANVWKTAAFNVDVSVVKPSYIPTRTTPDEAKPERWILRENAARVLFSGTTRQHMRKRKRLDAERFADYSIRRTEIFIWARAEYCDSSGSRHW